MSNQLFDCYAEAEVYSWAFMHKPLSVGYNAIG